MIATAFLGAWLVIAGSGSARATLTASAVAGFATAAVLWIPAGITVGAAAAILEREAPESPRRGRPAGARDERHDAADDDRS